jgi:arylsulfatase A-like enzyme
MTTPNTSKPNLIIILADDMGWMDAGYQGSEIQTPHIDQLASEGARLNQFYVMPACTPTRASMLTGRYTTRYGMQTGVIKPTQEHGLPTDEVTLAEVLNDAGYYTAITGKWHLGHSKKEFLPSSRGFDYQYGCYNGMIDYYTHMFNYRIRGISAGGINGVENLQDDWKEDGNDWNRNDQPLNEEGYATDLIADEAIKVVENHDTATPLFLYVAFTAPHSPLQVPEKYQDMYQPEDMTIPKGPLEAPVYSIGGIKDEELQRRRSIYASMVTCMDDSIGRIMDSLKKQGMDENTILFFCSDNGGAPDLGALNDPLRGSKTAVYEGGVRVPAFMHCPEKIKANTSVDEALHMVDIFPTFLQQAGISIDLKKPLDGKNIWPTITEGKPTPHDEVLINAAPYHGAIVVDDWKLVRNGHLFCMISNEGVEDRYELFNLAQDIGETTDLSEKFPDKLNELKQRLDQHTKEAVTPFNLPETWPPAPPTGPKPLPNEKYPQRWRDKFSGTPKAWGHED